MALLCLMLSIVRPHNPWDYSAVTQTFVNRRKDTEEQRKTTGPIFFKIKGCRKSMQNIIILEHMVIFSALPHQQAGSSPIMDAI